MPSLTGRGLDTMREDYPQAYTALQDIVASVNSVASAAGVGSLGPAATPQAAGSLDVVAADGVFDAAITDSMPSRGEWYFLEWDTDSSFSDAITIALGPARNWRGFLGNLTLYFRWYKQLFGSNVSSFIYFGGNTPASVAGGGALAGPPPHDTEGSGTSSQPGAGWGAIGATQPIPVNL